MTKATLSGHPAVDRYLAEGYASVPGMSSRFSAGICGHLVRRQTELGIAGDVAEIGAFEGRFLIALALGLATGERAYGFDTFDWPDAGIEARFRANCARHGVGDRVTGIRRDSRSLDTGALRALLEERPVRFFHIDGDHGLASLASAGAFEAHGAAALRGIVDGAHAALLDGLLVRGGEAAPAAKKGRRRGGTV